MQLNKTTNPQRKQAKTRMKTKTKTKTKTTSTPFLFAIHLPPLYSQINQSHLETPTNTQIKVKKKIS